jgi:hypothetical protein
MCPNLSGCSDIEIKTWYDVRAKLAFAFLLISSVSLAQQVQLKSGFVQDSIKIGLPVQYWLSARYPAYLDVFLPDSTHSFSPFEYAGRSLFETRLDSSYAIDSVVYSLVSFEIDKIQFLKLPALLFHRQDTSVFFSPKDSVFLMEYVYMVSDTTKLKSDTRFVNIPLQVNYPLYAIILTALALILLILLLVFGQNIRRYYLRKKLAREHLVFCEKIGKVIEQLKSKGAPELAGEGLNLFKVYIEKLEKVPFTKLTTREISALSFTSELVNPLRAIDRCVFGKMESGTIYQDFQQLEDFAEWCYKKQFEKLSDGK